MFFRVIVFFLALVLPALPVQARSPQVRLATPALWEVSGPTGNGTLYLFGTFHLLPKDINWQSKAIDRKLKLSKIYVFELTQSDMTDPASQQLLLSKGLLPTGQSLDTLVGPDLFAKVEIAGKAVGLPPEALKRLRPWMAAVLMSTQAAKVAGFEPGSGVETILQARAAKSKTPVMALETMADQVEALAALDADGAYQMLEETAVELSNAKEVFAEMLTAWASGDSARLEAAFLDDMETFPKAYEALLKQRNLRWLPKLEALLQQRYPAFVAVGAGHLIGPDGIVSLLRAKNYKIKQVQPK
jgi:uncharacterized protein